MKKQIKIFMCVHKPFSFVPPLATAVQGGAAINHHIEGTIGDDGALGSISEKNAEYCELTVQYYAYKNESADYFGFCHYRRFFGASKKNGTPYTVTGRFTEKKARRLLLSEADINALCDQYDVILPRAEDMAVSTYKQYTEAKHHHKEDLELFVSLLKEKYPFLAPFAEEYLSGTRQYFCNMFIMKEDIFSEYCKLLFPLLSDFDEKKTLHEGFADNRTDGYLGERFLGIFIAYARSEGKRVFECRRIDTECSFKKRVSYFFFPPESKRRFFVKRLLGLLK
ncbi:MAG: DUF4422 domain-containing protein [Ruminococcaceae bacterium]|nr:DUF4422 domain-containing protein [Oscillospiraceae bacterium]